MHVGRAFADDQVLKRKETDLISAYRREMAPSAASLKSRHLNRTMIPHLKMYLRKRTKDVHEVARAFIFKFLRFGEAES